MFIISISRRCLSLAAANIISLSGIMTTHLYSHHLPASAQQTLINIKQQHLPAHTALQATVMIHKSSLCYLSLIMENKIFDKAQLTI